MKLRCLLVDDEPHALKILESYISNIDTLEIAGRCRNAFEAMSLLQQMPVDLLFLDIKMPKLSGTEFLRTLLHPPKVIFTSAYKDYAIEGFELDAVDYLEKPFSLERFIKAINKLGRLTGQGNDGQGNDVLSNEARSNEARSIEARSNDASLYFRSDRKMVKVRLDEIVFIESLKDYVRITRAKEKPLLVKRSISSVEAMLPEDQFLRIHRSYIVSIKKVTAFTQNDVEINGQEIPIGKLYSEGIGRLAGR